MHLQTYLADMKRRGIELSAIDGLIKFRAPKGTLTSPDREFLANNKAAILELLNLDDGYDSGAPAVSLNLSGPEVQGTSASDTGRQPDIRHSQRSAKTLSRATTPPASTDSEARSDSRNSINSRNSSPSGNFTNFANIAMAPGEVERGACSSLAEVGVEDQMVVRLGDRIYTYSVWDGERLDGDRLGFDTETDLARDHEVPELALATVSNGTFQYVIHSDRLGEFFLLHRDKHLVFHNVAFDHWVIVKHLTARGETEALQAWWEAVDDNHVHDTMHLDWLIRLGRTDADPKYRDLAMVAGEYTGLPLDKSDPYRLRYGETIGQDWATVERGFFEYAIKDPIATLATYEAMISEAARIMSAHGLDAVEVARQHGYLSEIDQVKGAIAFADVTRIGLATDREEVAIATRGHRGRLQRLVDDLITIPGCTEVLRRNRRGEMILRPSSGAPSLSQDQLRKLLVERASLVTAATGLRVPLALTPSGKITLKESDWTPFSPFDPFIRTWLELEQAAKACQFLAGLTDSFVHPKYGFTRTARTRCSGPNIQQMPRKGGFRECFVARPGHLFLIVDYRFIELVTLAAICEATYSFSRLADVIRAGTDPHAYTAALLAGMSFEQFKALAASDSPGDRERYADLRQKAKAVNFGIPGGQGAASLVAYALANYGVEMSLDEADRFREKLISEVYPELALYLADDGMETLARNLGSTVEACWKELDWKGGRSGAVVGGVRNVVGGKTLKTTGEPYKKRYLDGVWNSLNVLNRNLELAPLLARREAGEDLRDRLFRTGVTTLTGRVRGRVSFTQARNTPFQGLAADGAKLALFELIRDGYLVVAFVHDEVVIELPEDVDHAAEARYVESLLNLSMECVTGNVPVSCEYALCRRWSKKAKACFDGDGRLVAWEDKK